jgi:hypothetical protein
MTKSSQHSIAALIGGIVLLLGGLFGVFYQGPFWSSDIVHVFTPGEIALAIGLPAGVLLSGVFLLSYVLWASPLTAHWTQRRREFVFLAFALGVLLTCAVASWIAGHVVARNLEISGGPSNQQVEATAPRAGRLVRHMFYNVIFSVGAALPGAVPHLGR